MPIQVRVCSTATYPSFASLSDFKSLLNISDDNSDTSLQLYLDGSTDVIEGNVGRVLRQQVYEERIGGEGSEYLQLCHWPVESIESIKYGLVSGTVTALSTTRYELIDSETGLIYREDTFPWTVRGHIGLNVTPLPSEPLPWYVVVYTAGYTQSNLPKDLVLANLEAAKAWWRLRGHNSVVKTRKVDDFMITYKDGGFAQNMRFPDLPPEAAAVVNRYMDLVT